MLGIAEPHRRLHRLATPLDKDPIRTVHHDVADGFIRKQRLQRSQPDDIMHQFGRQATLLACIQLNPVLRGDL
jgi:hypothetical protein